MVYWRRYSLEDTCELLHDLGFHDTSPFVQHSVAGADLLDLSQAEMENHLHLSPLQVFSSSVRSCPNTCMHVRMRTFQVHFRSALADSSCCAAGLPDLH